MLRRTRQIFRRSDVIVGGLATIALIFAFGIWLPSFHRRSQAVHTLSAAAREITFTLDLDARINSGVAEHWRFVNRDGLSTIAYHVGGQRGVGSVLEPAEQRLAVSALYDQLSADGIWNIASVAGGADRLSVSTKVGASIRRRVVRFGAAELAPPKPGEYHLDLGKTSARDAFAQIHLSAKPEDSRYAAIVAAYRAYGSTAFRSACASTKKRVR